MRLPAWFRFRNTAVPVLAAACLASGASPASSQVPDPAGVSPRLLDVTRAGEVANDNTASGGVSPDGRFVVLESEADNLVPDDGNRVRDVFVLDRDTGVLTRESLDDEGSESPMPSGGATISANGRFVVFASTAPLTSGDSIGVANLYHRDRVGDRLRKVTRGTSGEAANGDSSDASLSSDGRVLAFASLASNLVAEDRNGVSDIFAIRKSDQRIVRVSVASDGGDPDGASFQPHLSGNGRFVAFVSTATNLVPGVADGRSHVYVTDIETGTTVLASVDRDGVPGNDASFTPRITDDGNRVTFGSRATNLASRPMPAGTIYVHDVRRGRTRAVSVDAAGEGASGSSFGPTISGNGRFVAFSSNASGLVPELDPGVFLQIWVHDVLNGTTALVSRALDGGTAGGASFRPHFTAGGGSLVFSSTAEDLAPGARDGTTHVYASPNSLVD